MRFISNGLFNNRVRASCSSRLTQKCTKEHENRRVNGGGQQISAISVKTSRVVEARTYLIANNGSSDLMTKASVFALALGARNVAPGASPAFSYANTGRQADGQTTANRQL
jgi:hypothetical protein